MRRALIVAMALAGLTVRPAAAALRAGAALVDVTPDKLPVITNGFFYSEESRAVGSRLYARAIALDDGKTRAVMVMVDSCMLDRVVLDDAKRRAAAASGIPVENMLIASTHTHSAPSAAPTLGVERDPHYPSFLIPRIARAVQDAVAKLEPVRIGWAVADASKYLGIRRWVVRPDRVERDPFGNRSVRANLHVAGDPENATGPTASVDPDLSMIAFQALDGRPVVLLANLSMHYHGGVEKQNGQEVLSADYFGLFAERMQARIGPSLTAIMSQGTSGDVWRRDYFGPPIKEQDELSRYTDGIVDLAYEAYKTIRYRDDATLAVAQSELALRYRLPTAERLAWGQQTVKALGKRLPKTLPEVYAREAVLMSQAPDRRLILQALRIGDIGITAIPNEVFALTGLKLKAHSPLPATMNITLANGAEGYIPPPEQFRLGGYTTWEARTAGLEERAEPKITEAMLALLEKVAGRPRRAAAATKGAAARAVLATRPRAYFRLDEAAGTRAVNLVDGPDGYYEPGVVFWLEGPRAAAFTRAGETNRAALFAGGRLQTRLPPLRDQYTVSLWFWNGMPTGVRALTGVLFGRGHDQGAPGEHLGIGGKGSHEGKLVYAPGGDAPLVAGRNTIRRWTWHNVVLSRSGGKVSVHLDGQLELEAAAGPAVEGLFIGGRSDSVDGFEGRLDEVGVWNRPLARAEIARLYAAAGGRAKTEEAAAGLITATRAVAGTFD